ncbi:MAG: hypothetical protein ABUK01_18080 [Leptospirales bacterium]
MSEKKPIEVITKIYFLTGLVGLGAAALYAIFFAKELPGPLLRGPLITWAHIFTLGILFPFYAGLSIYRITSLNNIELKISFIWKIHYALYILALPVYLFLIFGREGGRALTVVGLFLFVSLSIYAIFYLTLLKKVKKADRKRSMFWVDILSLFFLFQTACFGALLVTNLEFGWFYSEIAHSVRVHAHSGMIGFFYLVIMMGLDWKSGLSDGSRKWFKISAWAAIIFVFVWTSVHDKKPIVFAIAWACYTLTLIPVVYILLKNRKAFGPLLIAFLFLGIGVLLAIDIIASPSKSYIFEKNIPTQYGVAVFTGFLIPAALALYGLFTQTKLKTVLFAAGGFFTIVLMLGFYFTNSIAIGGSMFAVFAVYGLVLKDIWAASARHP